jgi:hypothetical protein
MPSRAPAGRTGARRRRREALRGGSSGGGHRRRGARPRAGPEGAGPEPGSAGPGCPAHRRHGHRARSLRTRALRRGRSGLLPRCAPPNCPRSSRRRWSCASRRRSIGRARRPAPPATWRLRSGTSCAWRTPCRRAPRRRTRSSTPVRSPSRPAPGTTRRISSRASAVDYADNERVTDALRLRAQALRDAGRTAEAAVAHELLADLPELEESVRRAALLEAVDAPARGR